MSHAFRLAAAALAAGMLAPAHAASDKFQRIEFFGAYGQIESDGFAEDFDGIGGGLRVVGGQRVGFFGDFQGEYIPTKLDGDGADLDFQNYRAGAGWGFPAFGPLGFFQLKAEYVSLRTELEAGGVRSKESQNGYGVHLQFEQDLAYDFGIHASLGYLGLDDIDGTEYVIGFHWVPDVFGFFAQLRWDDLKVDEGGGDLEIQTIRAGFRVPF